MNILSDKKKLIQILFGLAFLFLIANIIADKLTEKHYTPLELSKSGVEINLKFQQALSNYGVIKEWIHDQKRLRKDDDSLLFKYIIDVPKDLPIALLLNEIDNSLTSKSVILKSREIKIGGETVLKIFSGDNLKLQANFNYKEGINRNKGSIGFLINDYRTLSSEKFDEFLHSPEKFTLIVVPSINNKKIIEKIIANQKEAAILISDENTDLDYKMNAGYSQIRIVNCIKAITADFSNAAFLVLDDNSKLYSSPQMNIIKSELDKRKIKYYKKSSFFDLTDLGKEDLIKEFNSKSNLLNEEGKLTFQITPDEFYTILPEIINLRKLGYKFVRVSQNL